MDELEKQIDSFVYQKLEAGIGSLFDILVNNTKQLKQLTGLSSQNIEELKRQTSHIVLKNQLSTADTVPCWERVSTGCESIDKVLEGGIPINGITEISGCSGVGKTQLCLQLALMIQLTKNQGGNAKGAVYICTEDIFPIKRFHQMAKYFSRQHGMLQTHVENNVFIDHSADYEQLRRCLSVHLPNLLRAKNIGLLVVDSIAGVFRGENYESYVNRGQDIVDIASTLHNLCDEYNIAVVCVNQVTHDINSDKIEPCLGLAWSNNITYQCSIVRKNESSVREFEVVFAPDLPSVKCPFAIKEHGIVSIG